MDISISDDTLKETIEYKQGIACLSGRVETLCRVEYVLGVVSLVFVEMPKETSLRLRLLWLLRNLPHLLLSCQIRTLQTLRHLNSYLFLR
jgi:hypothetical protein